MTILVLDNYDSFTYNLVQYLGDLGVEPVVYRNDALAVPTQLGLGPEAIVISPGPGVPADRPGISIPLVGAAAGPDSRSSASASATRPSARPSGAGWSGPRG